MGATAVISPLPHPRQIKNHPIPTSHSTFSSFPTSPHHSTFSSSVAAAASAAAASAAAAATKKPSPHPKLEKIPPSPSTNTGRSRRHFLKLIRRTVRAGEYDKALDFLELMISAGHRSDSVPCANLISGLCSSHSLRKAERVMEIVELHGHLDTITCNAFLTGLCRCNQVDIALSFLTRMRRRNCPPNSVSYNILLGELCFRRRLDDAFDLHRVMLDDDACRPCEVTYTILVEALISEGTIAEAVELLEHMFDSGLTLNSFTYRAIVRGLCRKGHVDDAWQMVRHQRPSISSSAFLDVGSYNTLLKGLLDRQRWRDAGDVVAEMFADGRFEPNLVTYGLLLCSFCQKGMVGDAVSLLEDIVRRGLKPTGATIDPVVEAYSRQLRVGRALGFLERMVSVGCLPSIMNYNKIMGALCRSRRALEAARLLRQLEHLGLKPNTCSYNTVVGGLWAEGERAAAVELVGEMVRSGMVTNEITFNLLISCLCREGMVDEALELVEIMEVSGVRPTTITYNAVLLGLCKARREVEAIDVFVCQMMRMGDNSRRGRTGGSARITRPTDATYEILVEGLSWGGYREEAAELANALVTSNVISEKSKRRVGPLCQYFPVSASPT